MGAPLEIRQVKRPVNTIVEDTGRPGPQRYRVRERAWVKYVPGGNPQPRNGRVIGYIYEGQFIQKQVKTADEGPEFLSYGASALVKSVTKDIFNELLEIYPIEDVILIMSIATLRVIKPGTTASRLSTHYKRTFVCKDYPEASISKNTVSSFLNKLGQDGGKRRLFYQKRLNNVCKEHHIALDGTLKQDSSTINDLSAFSYKSRVKGCADISVLYAYDIELMEPVCAQVFPGNCIDASSYKEFIKENNICKGIIVADKGFPPSKIQAELEQRPDLHFITPIKRNDRRIADNKMFDFDGLLTGLNAHVLYKKCTLKNGKRFLYAFKDSNLSRTEEATYLALLRKSGKFDLDKYKHKKDSFGVIVFESDQDLPAETIYSCYDDRWLLELVFKRYKNDECLDATHVHGDFSIIGSEFINFLATLATCRILRKARKAGLLEKMSYGDMMEDLLSAWRKVDAPSDPKSDDGAWIHTLKVVFEELEALGLSAPAQQPVRKTRGRPRKKTAAPSEGPDL